MDYCDSDKSLDPTESKTQMVDLLDVSVGCSTVVYTQVSESEEELALHTNIHPIEYFVQEDIVQIEEKVCDLRDQYEECEQVYDIKQDELHENDTTDDQNSLHFCVIEHNSNSPFRTIDQEQYNVQSNLEIELESHNNENFVNECMVKTSVKLENTMTKICPTCLMTGRSLAIVRSADTAYSMLQAIKGAENIIQHNVVCWECNSHIQRMLKFGQQVLHANNVLSSINNEKQKEISGFSSLTASKKVGVDMKIIYRSCDLPPKRKNKSRWNTKDPPTRQSTRTKKNTFSYKNTETMKTVTDLNDTAVCLSTEEINAENLASMVCKENVSDSNIIKHEAVKDSESLKRAKAEMRKKHKSRTLMQYRLKKRLASLLVKRRSNTKIVASTISEQDMLRFREERMKHLSYVNAIHRCEMCIKGFPYLDHLRRHNHQIHSESAGQFSCEICQLRTKTSDSLVRHRKTHYNLYMCTNCDFTTPVMAEARAHWTNVHEKGKQFPCGECDMVFDTMRRRRYHRQVEHRAANKCHVCEKSFTTVSVLKEHMTLHTGKKQIPCSECGKLCRGEAALYAHLRNAHGRNDPPAADQLYCSDCNLQFRTKSSYRAHLYNAEIHVPPALLRFECTRCEKRFRTSGLLNAHRMQYHASSACHVCGKAFSSVYTVRGHVRRVHEGHVPSERHVCELCGKAFSSVHTMRGHVRRVHEGHAPSKRHVCELCGKAFATASRFDVHALTHANEKPCECNICHMKFSEKGPLAKHIKRHTTAATACDSLV